MATINLINAGDRAGRLLPGQARIWSCGTLAAVGSNVSLSVLSQAQRTPSSDVYSLELTSFRVVTGPAGMNLNWITTNDHPTTVIESIHFTYCVIS